MQPGRNDPCPCGSGRKYKKCCGAAAAAPRAEAAVAVHDRAEQALRQGRFHDAMTLCTERLRVTPDDTEALHLLGLAQFRAGQVDTAADTLGQAIALEPGNAAWHANLALVLQALGRLPQAEASARRALALDLQLAEAHNNLGQILAAAGRIEEAIAAYERAAAADPREPLFRFNLAAVLHRSGTAADAAARHYRAVLERAPDFAPALANLGALCLQQRRADEAQTLLARARAADPYNEQVVSNLGLALLDLGDLAAAAECFEDAIRLKPGFAGAYSNLGIVREQQGRADAAVEAYQGALQRDPGLVLARQNLLVLRNDRREIEAAHALALEVMADLDRQAPVVPAALQAFQAACDFENRVRAAESVRRQAESGALGGEAIEFAFLALNYEDEFPASLTGTLHRAWGAAVERTTPLAAPVPQPTDRGSHPLRIGYLSPDFRDHATAYFIEPVIAQHDRARVRVHCYHTHAVRDGVTARIERLADEFAAVSALDDAALAARIAADEIDVLVDLAGHTLGSRLKVLARRPAPVQITYLGYPNTTGLARVDHILTDAFIAAGSTTPYAERPLVLSGCAFTFSGDDLPRSRVTAPAHERGDVTYGSFNNLRKITPSVVRLWARALAAAPSARLLIAYSGAEKPLVQGHLRRGLAAEGVDPQRIEFAGGRPREQFLRLYNEVDIMLDTWPYSGTTTTCEALWMGVPVVTLAGTTHASRVSGSILHGAGFGEWVAFVPDEYAAIAARLAGDPAALGALRVEIPRRLRESSIGQPRRLARQLEAAYERAYAEAAAGHSN